MSRPGYFPCESCCDFCANFDAAHPTTVNLTLSGITLCCNSGGGSSVKYTGTVNGSYILELAAEGIWRKTILGVITVTSYESPGCSGEGGSSVEELDLEVVCSGLGITINVGWTGGGSASFFRGSCAPNTLSPALNEYTACDGDGGGGNAYGGTATVS